MEYTQIGSLTVSRLGYGCYAMSGVYGTRDPAIWEPLIHAAHSDLGITFFDTADEYGPAEEILGRAVAPFRDEVILCSKVGVADGRMDTSRHHIVASCEASLTRLGTDRIDLYQVHYDDPTTPVADTVAALDGLRAAGKIREYGVGHMRPARVREYLQVGRPASALFELSAVSRASARSMQPLLAGHEQGLLAGIAFSPTGRGLLTGGDSAGQSAGVVSNPAPGGFGAVDPLRQRERLASALRIAARLGAIGERYGKTTAQTAIAWVLAQQGIAAALTGPSSLTHLRENAGACGWRLAPGDLAEMAALLDQEEILVREAGLTAAAEILGRPLPRQGDDACRDLIYVIETAAEHGWATEEQLTPLIFAVMAVLRRREGYDASLETVRHDLAGLLSHVWAGCSGTTC